MRLPGRRDVFDLFSDRFVGRDLSEFTVEMGEHETRLWHLSE